jgi:hypothetical protein
MKYENGSYAAGLSMKMVATVYCRIENEDGCYIVGGV